MCFKTLIASKIHIYLYLYLSISISKSRLYTHKVYPEKVQPLWIWEWFAWYWCNLTAKESGLECACVNNEDFTVLVSEGSKHHWVSMCTVRTTHSKWLSKKNNESVSNFALSLNIPPQKLFRWLRRLSGMMQWVQHK